MNKAERTRQFIIEQSASIINRKGMAGTSMSDIMEATKLAKGGIYGNFQSKDEICMESFLYLTGLMADRLDRAVAKGKTARDKFFNLMEAYKTNKGIEGGCPILNFGVEADDTHPFMKDYVKKAIRSSQKRIFDILSQGIADKELSHSVDAANLSIKVFAMIEGGILCRRVLESDEQMRIIMEAIRIEFESYLL